VVTEHAGTVDSEFDPFVQVARCGALSDGKGVLSALAELHEPVDNVAATLQRHQVGELAVQAIRAYEPGSPTAAAIDDALAGVRWAPPVGARLLLDSFVELRDAFAGAGIPVLILKGAVLAQRLYGGLDRRPQYDLDVLVPRAAAREARRVMLKVGYKRVRRDQHAASFACDPVEVDLHWALRSAPAYAIDHGRVWEDAVPVVIDDVAARTLSDEHLLLLLSSSVVEDTGLGVARLKQLCDLWLLVRELDTQFDWAAWFCARRSERLETMVANGLALTLEVLETLDDAPRLCQALEARSDLLHVNGREHAKSLLAAPRNDAASSAWFDTVYPGSPLLFRTHSFVAGLPASLRDVRPTRYFPLRRR
jgi:Uncharacterised nucleotidyltransferase